VVFVDELDSVGLAIFTWRWLLSGAIQDVRSFERQVRDARKHDVLVVEGGADYGRRLKRWGKALPWA